MKCLVHKFENITSSPYNGIAGVEYRNLTTHQFSIKKITRTQNVLLSYYKSDSELCLFLNDSK